MKKPKLLVFASGTKTGGGSGFGNLVNHARSGVLSADIVGVVSNHEHGGVRERAEKLGVPFIHFGAPWDREGYARIARDTGAEFFALSGWIKLVTGLPPERTINIHPGPLPQFGGQGMYGHHVHEAVMAAFWRGEITHTAVCMHFVTEEYDRGPTIFRLKIPILKDDTSVSLAVRVNAHEHDWQPIITDLVVNRKIIWHRGVTQFLTLPPGYTIERLAE